MMSSSRVRIHGTRTFPVSFRFTLLVKSRHVCERRVGVLMLPAPAADETSMGSEVDKVF